MQVNFMTSTFELTPPLREHLARCLHQAFVSLQNKIQSVSIALRDLNGPNGGCDMLCEVVVVIPGRPTVFIKNLHADMYAAIDSALRRASYRATQLVRRRCNSFSG